MCTVDRWTRSIDMLNLDVNFNVNVVFSFINHTLLRGTCEAAR